MAKDITHDRFRIIAETSAETVGPLLAILTRMGLENISYELITDVRAFERNGERKVHSVKAEAFVVETFLPTHTRFRPRDLVGHFAEDNRTAGSAYFALKILLEKRILKKDEEGWYEVAPKQLPPPIPVVPEVTAAAHRKKPVRKQSIRKFK